MRLPKNYSTATLTAHTATTTEHPLKNPVSGLFQRFTTHLIDSPCIAVCKLDAARTHCSGCFRTVDEIEGWPVFSREQKYQVISDAAERKAAAALKP